MFTEQLNPISVEVTSLTGHLESRKLTLSYNFHKQKNIKTKIPLVRCWVRRGRSVSAKLIDCVTRLDMLGRGNCIWSSILLAKIWFCNLKFKLKKTGKFYPWATIKFHRKSFSLQDMLLSGTIFWQNQPASQKLWNEHIFSYCLGSRAPIFIMS